VTKPGHDAGSGVGEMLPELDARGRSLRISVLTRPGCHLCVRAVSAVADVCDSLGDVGYAEVDIDEVAERDQQVRARYGEWVPVTFVDGTMHDYFTVDPERLREALTST